MWIVALTKAAHWQVSGADAAGMDYGTQRFL